MTLFGRARSFGLVLVIALAVAACSNDGGGGDEPANEEPERTYGTADAEALVLDASAGPSGMSLLEDTSGPQTLYQFTSAKDRVDTLTGFGTTGGYAQHFSVEAGTTAPKPAKPLNATAFDSENLIFEDNDGATEALDWLRDNPNPQLEDVKIEDASELGEGAFLQISKTSDGFTTYGYIWRVDNAILLAGAQSPSSTPDKEELLSLAEDMSAAVASAEPTGEALELPPSPEPGDVVFEDDFEKEGEWDLVFPTDPPGRPLSRYVNGRFELGIDGAGARWNDTTEFKDKALHEIGDAIVEIDAEEIEGDTARWGVMCRLEKGGGWYLSVIGADGFAGVFRATAPDRPLNFLSVIPESAEVRDAVAAGQHKIRLDCAGDPIARLSLYVNDELITEALDDDPLGPGAVGLWVESQGAATSVQFDNFLVSEGAAQG